MNKYSGGISWTLLLLQAISPERSPPSHLSPGTPYLETKETKDFSLAMLLLFAAGMLLWTAYGIGINSLPVIAANVITFGLVLFLLE